MTAAEMTHEKEMFDKQVSAAKDDNPTPACQLVADGTNTISISGIKSFTCYGNTSPKQVPVYQAKKSTGEIVADKVLRAVEILANPFVSLAIHKDNNTTQRHMSDNSVKTHSTTMGTIQSISNKGMDQLGATASEGINVGRTPPAAPPATPAIVPVP
jgi:hypothetical protein